MVVSHGGAIATALAMIIDRDPLVWPTYQMDNCGLTELQMQPEPQITLFNDLSHLDGMSKPRRWAGL